MIPSQKGSHYRRRSLCQPRLERDPSPSVSLSRASHIKAYPNAAIPPGASSGPSSGPFFVRASRPDNDIPWRELRERAARLSHSTFVSAGS